MKRINNNPISYKKSLLICLAVFLLYFTINIIMFLLNGERFNPNNDTYLSFFAIDFRLGFVNRVLIGGLISLFKDTWTSKDLASMFFVNLFILIAVCVPIAARAFQKGRNNNLPILEYAAILFLFSPFTISEFIEYWAGYDIFWVFAVILCLFFIKNKYLRWFIPVLCFLAIFTHYGFVLAYLPVIFAILVYEYVKSESAEEKKSFRTLIIVTVAICFISFVYFVFFANNYIQVDLDELSRQIMIKTGRKLNMRYHATNYFNFEGVSNSNTVLLRDTYNGKLSTNPLNALWMIFYYHWTVNVDKGYFLHLMFTAAPLSVFFSVLWKRAAKNEGNPRLRRTYILFILIQCATLPFIFTSTDSSRWFSHPLFCQFILLYWVGMRDANVLRCFDNIKPKAKTGIKAFLCIYAAFSSIFYIVYNAYYLRHYFNTTGVLSFFWRNIY